jgi:hypothetical protein
MPPEVVRGYGLPGTDEDENQAWFMGFAAADETKIVISAPADCATPSPNRFTLAE